MSIISGEQKPQVSGYSLATGRSTLWNHVGSAFSVGKYDLPLANIDRAISLQHAGQNYSEISAEEANEQYGIEGEVVFDKPIAWKKAELINQYKRDELERMQRVEMGGPGLIRKTAYFGGIMASQAADPLNLAMMFVPVVGEGKFAQLVLKYGASKARLIAGATEAAVGAAMVEPLSYLSKSFGEQNEYSAKDTVANLVASVALGAGIRVVGGKLKDKAVGKYDAQLTLDTIKAKGSINAINRVHAKILDDAIRKADAQGFTIKTKPWKTFVEAEVKNQLKASKAELDISVQALKELTPETRRAAFMEGMNNLLYNEPVSGPQNVIELNAFRNIDKQVQSAWKRIRQEVANNKARQDDGLPPKEGTSRSTVVKTDEGEVEIVKSKDTEVIVANTDEAIELVTDTKGDPVERAAIIRGQAEAARKAGKKLIVDGEEVSDEAMDVMIQGEKAAHEAPVAEVPDDAGRAWEEPTVSEDHVDTSTIEGAHEAAKVTAEQINKQAKEMIAEMKKLAGAEFDRVKNIASKHDVDPVALARAASTDPTLLDRIDAGSVKAEDAVRGKKGIPKAKPKAEVKAKPKAKPVDPDVEPDVIDSLFEGEPAKKAKPEADAAPKDADTPETIKVDQDTIDDILGTLGDAPDELVESLLDDLQAPSKLSSVDDGLSTAADCIIKGLL